MTYVLDAWNSGEIPRKARDDRGTLRDDRGNTHPQTGFTLIELMIVVGIISILAALALPSYQRYTQRARFTEVLTTAESFKMAVTLALQEGAAPEELSNGAYGIPDSPPASKNLTSVNVQNGIITATGSALTENATLILTPNENGSRWFVSGSCLAKGFCHD